ncbi:uncharacterized protein LOC113543534 isoform X1 [Pangasianodon hypophthalmus]|uniref:uncharacterized protein LOC113543534 isoform X1 n=1 Tax=Pangasianodon hypophthalmus TaxID=310915 RepID=UPI002306FB0A|nr:uncharacterized protein LOC113543534 isoform X1 [Pangasianodon hypophthalmus]XP_026797626.3 uncharacterized protein LOC113543534 isoform X1 [Pangasianodon hypophthalmus]XP_026797627.3 uncharacterized protein LOC113543534 isoform X1 [Pangasianodon hypophthalmus]XP_026797628.3 uncharacterized protein LOC113543534 isoform X1 [Pangasianodon hypophthalmus]
MEVRGRKGSIEISTSNPTKPVGTVALRNFTIPRKKRVSGQVLLEPCPEDSRDYTLIQSKLRESRLDMRKEHANAWLWKDVKLVNNDGFLKEFSEKRSEMRTKGRHGREMEERFCFLVASYEATSHIYQFGLRTGSQDQYSLGKPSHGVYLFKHVDVALKHATASTCSGKNLIVFKVLFGKVKKVIPSLEWNRTVDPMVGFDCHMAKDAVSYRDSLSQQVLGSSVFLFDYDENQELNKRPRQCLPYAVVSFTPDISATAPTSISPPVSPTKPSAGLMHGPLENLKGCTVAKRTGKGENATVTFKRFATQGCPGVEYQPQAPRVEANGVDATPFQSNDLQKPPPFIPQQSYIPNYNTAEYFNPSLPYYDNGIPWQNYMDNPAFLSNVHNLSTTSIYGGNTDTLGVIPQTSAEKISTIVYSSRLVKDPRLSRQETNIQKKTSEEKQTSSVPECEEQGYQAHSQNQKEENGFTLSCEKQSLELGEEHKEGRFPKTSLNDPSKPNPTAQPKTENMPSIKLFKMKFQKYAPYFKMTEEERQTKIWSKGNLTPEQKQLLIDRIHFYEMHHQRYKQGLLFQKDTETETAFSLSRTEPQNNDVCPSTLQRSPLMPKGNQCEVNQSHMRHSVSANASNLTPTTVLEDTERNKVDILNTDNGKLSQNMCNPKENCMQEKEKDPSSDSQTEPQNGGVVQSVKEKERISEMCNVQGTMQSNPSEKSKTFESTHDFAQSLCPSVQVEINNQDVHESEIPTSPKESFACKPTLSNTIEDCPEFEQHIIAMEVANCVDISATDVPEISDCSYATAMEPGQDSQSSTEKQDKEALTHSKSDTNSEMSIEVERGEAQQHNTIYNALYKRLQLDQLLSNSDGANLLSDKSYLRPKGLEKTLVIDLPDSHVNEPKEPMSKEEDLQLIVKIKSSQTPPERLTLSERFSKLRSLGRKLAAFVHVNRLTNSYTAHLNGDLKCKSEALISCSDVVKGTGNNNAELIKLMAQRYNENRFTENSKRLRQKRSKVLCRKSSTSSIVSKRTSRQLPFRVQRKIKHIRKSHLLNAKRKLKTKLALKISSCGQASFSKLTSDSSNGVSCTETANDVDKDSDSHFNSAAASQSPSGTQSHGELLNKGSSQNDNATSISTEESSCIDSENKTRHGDELSQTKGQCINPAKQSTEIVYHDVSKISNHNDIKKSQENITLESKDPVIIEEMETDSGTNNNKTSHQEKSSLVTSSGSNESSNESSNGESAEAKHKEEALLQKKPSQEDNCDTKEISPDYNTGAYEDTSSSFPTILNIPSNITSGNVISGCTAKAQTAVTPDSPRVMNNETDTQTEARILGDNAVDNSGSGLSKRVSSTNKAAETNKNANLQDRELYNNPKSTDANEKGLFSRREMSDADQNCLKPLKGAKDDVARIFTENTNHLFELASGSQSQLSLQDTKSSGIINSRAEATSDFHGRIIKDAQEDLSGIKDNLHSAWQGQDKNNLSATPDTQIISKLRDYLTKFEFTVKKQDTVNNSITEAHVPTAWITLDSTAHKQQLHDTRHYSRKGLADITHRQSETVHFHVAPTKQKQTDWDKQPNSSISKRMRMSSMERVSPDSTFTETARNEPNSHLVNKDTQPHNTASGVPNMKHWLQNHGNKLQENKIICPQGNGPREQPCKVNQSNQQTTYEQNKYSVTDISNTLKLADHAVSLTELGPLQSKCKRMLQHFISNFEKDQKVSFHQSCISRNLILEKYLDHPPAPVELKFEAINSFLELQMIMEACQFVDNKINFLRRKPTFRSLLWYDPSLYGELYKGTVGFQQQSSLFSSFQQCLTSDDYRRLREYYCAVSTLHQQLQDAPDTSYYMYLKTKRERLEIEAAFRNPSDVKSFFLSVPIAIMINLGDNVEILKKMHNIVMTFIETPADRLPGTFDVGKAEHLSIICRYLQEKMLFLKSHKEIIKISWFGMEHLLYDASKVLVWCESEHGMPNEVLTKYNRLNSQIVYGVTEACVALVNRTDQVPKPMDIVNIRPPQQMNAITVPSVGVSTERTQSELNIQMEDGTKETHQPPRRRATYPCPRSNFSDDVTPLIQPSLAAQPGSSPLYTDFTQRSNALHWRIPRNPWDWSPPDAIQSTSHSEIRALLLSKRIPTPHTKPRTTSLTDLQNNHAVRQQQVSQPLIVKPRPVERSKGQPTIGALQHPELLKEQANEFSMPMIPPFPFPRFSPDAPSVIPPPLPPLPFSSTSNQVALHNNPTPISYPFFVFNGQTYSTTGSSVPVSAIHTETQYLPRPV